MRSIPRSALIHGEPHGSDALRVRIRDRFGWEAEVVRPDQRVEVQ